MEIYFRIFKKLWNDNKTDFDVLSRVASECWYILAEWDTSIDCTGLDYGQFKKLLIEVTEFF